MMQAANMWRCACTGASAVVTSHAKMRSAGNVFIAASIGNANIALDNRPRQSLRKLLIERAGRGDSFSTAI